MTINYRMRCVTDAMVDGMPCQIIRYGISKEEANKGLIFPAWQDMRTPEYNYYAERVFIHAKEKTYTEPSLQTDRYAFGLGTFYQSRGIRSPQGIKANQGGTWSRNKSWKAK